MRSRAREEKKEDVRFGVNLWEVVERIVEKVLKLLVFQDRAISWYTVGLSLYTPIFPKPDIDPIYSKFI